MKQQIATGLVAYLMLGACSAIAEPMRIGTTVRDSLDYYAWISALSVGPTEYTYGPNEQDTTGRTYRIAVLTSEIYNTVLIEEISEGQEGCCMKLVAVRELDLEALTEKFSLRGETSGFEVIRWLSPTSLEVSLLGHRFVVSELFMAEVLVEER